MKNAWNYFYCPTPLQEEMFNKIHNMETLNQIAQYFIDKEVDIFIVEEINENTYNVTNWDKSFDTSFTSKEHAIKYAMELNKGLNKNLFSMASQKYINMLRDNGHYTPDNTPPLKYEKKYPIGGFVPLITESKDNINPSHYKTKSGLEAINVIEEFELDFCLGNALKYITRAGKKDGNTPEQDIKKAIWYLERKLKNLNK